MNTTPHGRWNRYREQGGETFKLCTGPLHDEDGAWLPLRAFSVMKRGVRKGKPISRCQACSRVGRGRGVEGGLIEVSAVWFVFRELEARIGRAETCRRLGVTPNLWYRLEHRHYERMYRRTARAAVLLLAELRADEVARHRDSIIHGAAARGRKERTPVHRRDFNGPDDLEAAYSRVKRARDAERKRKARSAAKEGSASG